MIFSFISGTAALAALVMLTRLTRDVAWLVFFTSWSACWLLGGLLYPELKTQEWHVAHECFMALTLTLYAVMRARARFSWLIPVGLTILGITGWFINAQPMTPHCAYRGLITLDFALIIVLFTQRGPGSRLHAHASVYLGAVTVVSLMEHTAWELSVPLAQALGRMASILFAISMIAIAEAARQERLHYYNTL